MLKIRDPFFDIVKAVAISMVVFCHVMWIAPVGTFPVWINNFRVGMNMPVFFVLSGYFAWPMIETRDFHKLGRNIRCYLQPALFAGVLFTLIGLAIGLVNHTPHDVVIRLVRSVFVDPWFITTLIECRRFCLCPLRLGGARSVVAYLLLRLFYLPLCVVLRLFRELSIGDALLA